MRLTLAALMIAGAPALAQAQAAPADPETREHRPAPAAEPGARAGAGPGARTVSRVEPGTYKVDPDHTQVIWKVDHLGFTPLYGAFGQPTGTLRLDPRNPQAAKVNITLPMSGLTVTSEDFRKHLASADFFVAAQYPTATFTSTAVRPGADGSSATVVGNLTIKGITKPVTLAAKFYGAGAHPRSQALNVGFTATGTLRRSDFALGMGAPLVSDAVDLMITAAFEK